MTDKRSLRADLRARRRAFAATTPGLPPAHPEFLKQLVPGSVVSAYRPVGGEADPALLIDAARAMGCRLALPHVIDRATPLRFLAWDGPLTAGPFGLLQPRSDADEMIPAMILTPLVGFDRKGNRLGQGAGHYDRAFAQYPAARRIGVAWSVQETSALIPDPWDVPLHAIATETEWIEA